jgi:hypothetical protein
MNKGSTFFNLLAGKFNFYHRFVCRHKGFILQFKTILLPFAEIYDILSMVSRYNLLYDVNQFLTHSLTHSLCKPITHTFTLTEIT